MSISASRIVSDVKEEFEGGSSLTPNWNILLRRAAQNLLENLSPATLKKVVPVYGGIGNELYAYYMPEDIAVPSTVYGNDGHRKYGYQPPKFFFADPLNTNNRFTIKQHNGVKFLYVRHSSGESMLSLETMETITGITGTATPLLDERNFVQGSASVKAVFDDSGKYLEWTLDSAVDVSDYIEGILLTPSYFVSKDNVSSIEIRLMTDDANYFSFNTTADSTPKDYLVEYWNLLRFSGANREETGAPDETSISKVRIYVTATSGNTVTVNFDRLSIQSAPPIYLEGYTNKMFIDSGTGLAKDTVDYSNDSVNLESDEAAILHYELALLVPGASKEEKAEFATQLQRKYVNYYDSNDSEEEPMSHNIMPDMNRETLPQSEIDFLDSIWNSND